VDHRATKHRFASIVLSVFAHSFVSDLYVCHSKEVKHMTCLSASTSVPPSVRRRLQTIPKVYPPLENQALVYKRIRTEDTKGLVDCSINTMVSNQISGTECIGIVCEWTVSDATCRTVPVASETVSGREDVTCSIEEVSGVDRFVPVSLRGKC
jgi:hypothetical protein